MNSSLDNDGLPISEVGEWSLQKHDRLRRYVDISRGVRKMFIHRAGATYSDIYCGPGRSKVRETADIIDGSPIVAASKAQEGGSPFSRIFVADADETFVNAACVRLSARGFANRHFHGAADQTVKQIVRDLDPYALHFAFVDPYNLNDLFFSTIEALASLQRMDMLIHVSVQDLQRNLRRYIDQSDGPLDHVAPGWRQSIDARQRDELIRKDVLQYWLGLIRKLNMAPSEGIELVSGSKNQRLYWLVFVSRHERAAEFWDKIRNVSAQGRLDV
jgi:three-Cys-motif partner protein